MKGNCRESPVNLFLLHTQFTKGNLEIRISALSKKYGYEWNNIFNFSQMLFIYCVIPNVLIEGRSSLSRDVGKQFSHTLLQF